MRICKNCKQIERIENITFTCEKYYCFNSKNRLLIEEIFNNNHNEEKQ